MSTYLKNMGGYKHNQLKSKSYEEIQKLFDNEMRRVNTFIPMDSEVVKRKKGTVESSKGTEDELEFDKSKKAESSKEKDKGGRKKILEVEVDDEAELKKHMVIVKDDDIAIDVIPLATKPPMIVKYKLLKEGIMIRVDDKLNFMEVPVEILEREFKNLKRSRIAIVKVRWNSKRGPEFTWEREDQMKFKYPYLFSDVSS
ncbi:hypothetical protein Tco_0967857 [Tanacetum coccineum]